jgi:hypothetical protein
MPTQHPHYRLHRDIVFDFVRARRFAVVLGLCLAAIAATAQPAQAQIRTTNPAWDPSYFLLNAFLLPALEQGAVPMRWFDPRPNLHCGPNTTVRINGEPLRVGASVPNQPFDLAWQTHNCRPFGIKGPRFDGNVTFTVYREDWGFSAKIVPAGLHYTWADGKVVAIKPGEQPMLRNLRLNDPID